MKKVIVIGAGASGLCAAIAAARGGASVSVLEAGRKPGSKLLLTGNGKCNLTNMDPELAARYNSSDSAALNQIRSSVLDKYSAADIRRFFLELGLPTREKDGYVYPVTMQASSVLQVLLRAAQRLGVVIRCNTGAQSLSYNKDSKTWKVHTANWAYEADTVIISAGSNVPPGIPAEESASGYRLAGNLGLDVTELFPALAGLTCRMSNQMKKAAGARTPADVSLLCDHVLIVRDTGEVQWTMDGVSGIVVFSLSRHAGSLLLQGKKPVLEIDLLPELPASDLASVLRLQTDAQKQCGGKEPFSNILKGLLNDRLICGILDTSGISQTRTCSEISGQEIENAVFSIKNLRLPVTGQRPFAQAQVCAGGIALSQIDPMRLCSLRYPSLYFSGEILDVDGPCGGYNLHWAWSSGLQAGTCAAQ